MGRGDRLGLEVMLRGEGEGCIPIPTMYDVLYSVCMWFIIET